MQPSDISILCVDDEEIAVTLRKLVLQKQGYRVMTAHCSDKALEMLKSSHFDLVLSDLLMPGGTGTELAQKIKQLWPQMPVVLVSGVNEIPLDAHFADLFISKVEGPSVLCEKIAAILAQRGLTS